MNAAVARSAEIFSQSNARQQPMPQERPVTSSTPVRKYEVCYLTPKAKEREFSVQARALPSVESAFSALGPNAIVQTRRGHFAVEDVWPGEDIKLSDGTYERLLWRGKITLSPANVDGEAASKPTTLTRVTSETYGLNRPEGDLVLGPSARILHRAAGIKRLKGCDRAFIPAADFVDGNTILEIAPTHPTPVYQFGFATHCSMSVNGLDVESLHPGTPFELGLRGAGLTAFLSLFPHKTSFEDFGLLAHPRLRLQDLDLLS
ncbi:Hint domain-containing protein [Loktanella sp. Alg231-35]|uniref:Hint domain-containing protein n=1 Tax=Loktanella sp. Alg231-35 TaxID=1922220 RepID=UPI001F21AEA5|nr:Hint domain-containing protein [Loktanella sp. Alg231-35]